MRICRIALDIANNNSAIATALYEVSEDGSSRCIPETARLWNDRAGKAQNSCLVPSVILYQKENQGAIEKDCYGHDALAVMKKANAPLEVCGNIKNRFFVEDEPYGKNAEDFCNLVKHLLNCIRFEEGEAPDAYELRVSHPVVCDEDNLFHLEEIIGEALNEWPMQIRSITFMDEAECAFRFALMNEKVRKAILEEVKIKKEIQMLVCDIGGSTMELSLYRFMEQGRKVKYMRVGMLRADEEAGRGMGSNRMDKMLRNKLRSIGLLDQNRLTGISEDQLMLRWMAPLKEDLNNRLREGREGRLDNLYAIAHPGELRKNGTITKEQFAQWCEGYAASVCKQIKKLAEQEGTRTEEISLAILTGGGCELYPVEDAIRRLLGDHARVLRPDDPRSVLDCAVDADNPDYIDGLCPKNEIASLSCVLGNLADETKLQEHFWVKKPVILKGYIDVGNFHEGFAKVRNTKGEYGYIDREGNEKITCQWKSIGDFHEGLAWIKNSNDLYGYIDRENNIVIPCQWSAAGDFHEGLAWVRNFNNLYGYTDRENNIVIPCQWSAADDFHCGRAKVQNDAGSIGFIDKNGKLIIPYSHYYSPSSLSYGDDFREDVFRAEHTRGYYPPTYGFIDCDGNALGRQDWAFLGKVHEGLARVCAGYEDWSTWIITERGYIDSKGQTVIPLNCAWDYVGDFHEGLAKVSRYGSYEYINCKGEVVIRSKGDWFFETKGRLLNYKEYDVDENNNFHEGLALVYGDHSKFDGKCGYIDREGNVVIPFEWIWADDFHEGLARVKDSDDKLGYIDRTGELVMICE